jgi:Zn finger protein HypA/HybF involved in hydrogenase expression
MTKQIALPRSSRNSPAQSFARLGEIAASQGLTLLTQLWHGMLFKYQFRCGSGHEFARIGTVVMRGTVTCLQCVQERTQRRFLEILEEQGTTCQEASYLGQTARQHFRCGHGHEWVTEARKILEGHGCPTCATQERARQLTHRDGLTRLQQAAAAHGGRCLADRYIGIQPKYSWECANGHRWQASGAKVVDGNWCRMCFARRNGDARMKPYRLEDLQARAASHGGECLDDVYRGINARYRFRCAKGHEWSAHGHLVLTRKTWCLQCANLNRRLTIEQMREVAHARGGRCLSETYLGGKVKLTWECHLGHVWSSTPGTVLYRGAWCPNCFRLRITRDPLLRKRYDTPR